MDSLRPDISENFGVGARPGAGDIVAWDGFDQLEKESAVPFFAGKRWEEVLEHLRALEHNSVHAGTYYLEEWSVLRREVLPYYLRAYLEYLLETLSRPSANEEFIFFLVGQLHEVIRMHKGSPFDSAQNAVLEKVAVSLADEASQMRFPYFHDDIRAGVAKFLTQLHAQAS